MAKKLIAKLVSDVDPKFTAKVYYDSEFKEYAVKFYKSGLLTPEATYHTDNKDDAVGAAQITLDMGTEKGAKNLIKPLDSPVRVFNLADNREYVFDNKTDPYYALAYAHYDDNNMLSWFFNSVREGAETGVYKWKEKLKYTEGKHSIGLNDWAVRR